MTGEHRLTGTERRVRAAEAWVFDAVGVDVDERFLDLAGTGLRVRVLSHGAGPPLVLLHGVTLSAAVWAPLFSALPGWRCFAVDLPGHGLSDPVGYRRGRVRDHARRLIDDLFNALELDRAPVVGHSLGGMFALWHAATGAGQISGLVVIGQPAVALAGVRVRMPLSLLTVPGFGRAVLRAPAPRPVYRRLLAQGLGHTEVDGLPDGLLEALRQASRRPQNAKTVGSLMHAINHFRRPRAESVLSDSELTAIATPTAFIVGSDDPYLSPQRARRSIDRIPSATVHELAAGHAPWLVDLPRSVQLIENHLCQAPRASTIARSVAER